MTTSFPIRFPNFKSPLRSLCRSFRRSRDRWRERAAEQKGKIAELQENLRLAQQRQRHLADQLDAARQENRELRAKLDEAPTFPDWANMAGHRFSAEMIALCCQLSKLISFRAVPKVLRFIAEAFGLPLKIPSRDAVRNWNCRNGLAILRQSEKSDEWIWMIDHSVQLGKMFVLVVLGVGKSQMPTGRPLTREDMTPLAVMPTKVRDKEEVSRQLRQVAEHYGMPLAIVSDGARELHEGAQELKTAGFTGVHLDDIKHKVSNLLKRTLGKEARFQAFMAKVGQTTASIQQTELDHLLPPRKKEKCRFMNYDHLIDWAKMAQSQLAAARTIGGKDGQRIMEKLGWLSDFEADLCRWRECRELIGVVLSQANHAGVRAGSTAALRKRLETCSATSALARQLREEMITFYQCNETKLLALGEEGLHLPCSTEVLESAFGSFKSIQGHHGRGTFTSLIAVFATLFDTCTPAKIRERFALVDNSDLKAWLKEAGLTNSTQSRRTRAYQGTLAPT